jgi:hypothetical protein
MSSAESPGLFGNLLFYVHPVKHDADAPRREQIMALLKGAKAKRVSRADAMLLENAPRVVRLACDPFAVPGEGDDIVRARAATCQQRKRNLTQCNDPRFSRSSTPAGWWTACLLES